MITGQPKYDFSIDACNHAECWENLTGAVSIRPQDLWRAGYEFHRWYVTLRFNPRCKYTKLRVSIDLNDGAGPRTVCSKWLGAD